MPLPAGADRAAVGAHVGEFGAVVAESHDDGTGSEADEEAGQRSSAPSVRAGGVENETTTWGSTTNAVLDLRDHLLAVNVSLVVIEATSDYWKHFYYVLAEDLDVILVNARRVKNLPGRKTDVSDAAWLAQLGAHGLVRPSVVPPEPVRELRDLTRARTTATRERSRVVQRLEKLLEDTGIKLSAVASDIMGVSGRAMLEALIRGEADPHTLADLAKRSLRHKIPELTEALTGRFREHHAFLARLHLDQYDQLTEMIGQLTGRVEEAMAPFRGALDLLDTIPGINRATAEVIVAETGGDMARFATAKHLASKGWRHRHRHRRSRCRRVPGRRRCQKRCPSVRGTASAWGLSHRAVSRGRSPRFPVSPRSVGHVGAHYPRGLGICFQPSIDLVTNRTR
jgi:transposase